MYSFKEARLCPQESEPEITGNNQHHPTSYVQNLNESLLRQIIDNIIGIRHPLLLSVGKAVVLQMGHRFFTISHRAMHAPWYL